LRRFALSLRLQLLDTAFVIQILHITRSDRRSDVFTKILGLNLHLEIV
jgi:hypothetical protein